MDYLWNFEKFQLKKQRRRQSFSQIVFFLRFWFVPYIKNLLSTSTLIFYISNLTLSYFKQLKMSDSLNKTLQHKNKL